MVQTEKNLFRRMFRSENILFIRKEIYGNGIYSLRENNITSKLNLINHQG